MPNPTLVGISKATFPRSEINLIGLIAGSYGSTGTATHAFTTVNKMVGTAFRYVSSAVDGDSIEILEEGVYSISFIRDAGGGDIPFGITRNITDTTLHILTIPATNAIANTATTVADTLMGCTVTIGLLPNDVIRFTGDTNQAGSLPAQASARIVKIV